MYIYNLKFSFLPPPFWKHLKGNLQKLPYPTAKPIHAKINSILRDHCSLGSLDLDILSIN